MRRSLATAICAPIRLRSPHSGQPTLRAWVFAGRRRHGSDGARQGKIARSWAVSWCASKAAHRLATVKPFQAAGRRSLEIGRVERATNRAGKSIEGLEFVQRAPIAVAWKQVVRAHFLRSGSGMYLSAVRLVPQTGPWIEAREGDCRAPIFRRPACQPPFHARALAALGSFFRM